MDNTEVENVSKTLTHLNVYSFQPRRKLLIRDMEINKKYKILSALKTLKMNKSKKLVIKLEIDKYYIYLPDRFKGLPIHIWSELNNQNFEICNTGIINKTNNLQFSNSKANKDTTSTQSTVMQYLSDFNYKPYYSEINQHDE